VIIKDREKNQQQSQLTPKTASAAFISSMKIAPRFSQRNEASNLCRKPLVYVPLQPPQPVGRDSFWHALNDALCYCKHAHADEVSWVPLTPAFNQHSACLQDP
jgi:hypothetical protein